MLIIYDLDTASNIHCIKQSIILPNGTYHHMTSNLIKEWVERREERKGANKEKEKEDNNKANKEENKEENKENEHEKENIR